MQQLNLFASELVWFGDTIGNGGTSLAQTRKYSHVTHSYWLVTQSITNYIEPMAGSCRGQSSLVCHPGSLGEHTPVQYYTA